MLESHVWKLPYVRLLVDEITAEEAESLRRRYGYVFLVVYGRNKPLLPGWQVQDREVLMIDLRQGLERIFANFKDNTRNEVRKAAKNKDLSFAADDRNWRAVYERYKKFERARGWRPALASEFRQSRIFSAYWRGTVIAGMTGYGHKDIMRVSKIFSIRNHNNIPGLDDAVISNASRKLVFDICRYADTAGFNRLDLGGVNFTDPEKAGISRFKSSFGGRPVSAYVCRSASSSFSLLKKFLFFCGRDIT